MTQHNLPEWRSIGGYEGLYEISSAGEVKSLRAGRVVASHIVGSGYLGVCLNKDSKRFQVAIHRLVAQAFLPGSGEVNHKNGVKTDNRVENLEWSTRSLNMLHGCYTLGHFVKPVIARNKVSGEVIEFPSIESTKQSGFRPNNVCACLYGLNKSHGGMTWEFKRPEDKRLVEAKRGATNV